MLHVKGRNLKKAVKKVADSAAKAMGMAVDQKKGVWLGQRQVSAEQVDCSQEAVCWFIMFVKMCGYPDRKCLVALAACCAGQLGVLCICC